MAERDAVEDLKYVEILRHLGYSTNFADVLEHWIREAQAQRERAERAEEALEQKEHQACQAINDILTAERAIRLAIIRGRLMQNCPPSETNRNFCMKRSCEDCWVRWLLAQAAQAQEVKME